MSAEEHYIEATEPSEVGVPIVSSVIVENKKAYIYVLWDRQYVHLYVADLEAAPENTSRPF